MAFESPPVHSRVSAPKTTTTKNHQKQQNKKTPKPKTKNQKQKKKVCLVILASEPPVMKSGSHTSPPQI
jgi:hypothetical protein